jgi:C1A family cysteine protease
MDFSYLRSPRVGLRAASYPSSYDLRAQGKLGAVEDQGSSGCCWDFASMDSLESCLLPGNPLDLSEDNLALGSGFDRDSAPYANGGNAWMAAAYLARWAGPMDGAAEPFGLGYVPAGLTPLVHVQDVLFLPLRSGPLDNDAIKSAVLDHGAVYTAMQWNGASYDATHRSFYYSGSATGNHAVDIVGWNDTYTAANFSTTPPGDGAFIVRNSWGPSWGEGGYFYLSYYDAVAGNTENAVFCGGEPTSNYSGIYQYDTLGMTSSLGYGSSTAWFGNQFTAGSSDEVAAMGFYAAQPGSSYLIYTSTSPGAAKQLAGSGTIAVPGYHTVPLTSPLALTAGQGFFVAVRLTTPGYTFPIPIEMPFAGYSSAATASAGQSYISSTGLSGSWADITSSYGNTSVCLKAFTRGTAPSETATLNASSVSPSIGSPATSFGYEVVWTDNLGHDPTAANVVIDGGAHAMTYVSGSSASGATYRYSTTLAVGSHDHHFEFSDADVSARTPGSGENAGPTVTAAVLRPDLAPVKDSLPPAVYPLGTADVGWGVENRGAGAAGPSTLAIVFSGNDVLDGGDRTLARISVASLGAGAAQHGTTRVTVPADAPVGTGYILLLADADHVVPQSNVANDVLAIPASVRPLASTRFSKPAVRSPVTVRRGMYVTARLYGAPARSRVAVQIYARGWKTRVWAYTSGGMLRKTVRLTRGDRGRRKVRVYFPGATGYRSSASRYVVSTIR